MVVVLGVGTIGLGCIQVLKDTTASRISAVDASVKRLEMARQLGADHTVNLSQGAPLEAVIELTGGAKPVVPYWARGRNADVVIDCGRQDLTQPRSLDVEAVVGTDCICSPL